MRNSLKHLTTATLILCLAPGWSVAQKPVIPVRVADLNPNGGCDPDELTTSGAGNSLVYFTARIPQVNQPPLCRIYATDGTANGTRMIESHSYYPHILQANSSAIAYTVPEYVSAENNDLVLLNHASNNKAIYRYSDIPNMMTSGARLNGDKLYMGASARNNPEAATEPYVFSSTGGTMTLLKNINTQSGYGSHPYGFTSLGSKMVFNASAEAYGSELWITDGTAAGTVMVKDLFTGATGSGPSGFTTSGSNSFFVAENSTGNKELWVTNGTTAGTSKLKEINPSNTVGSMPQELTAYNGKLFFTADNGTNGRELWVSNGTAAGTTMVKDIHASGSANPRNLVVYNGLVWFFATDGVLAAQHLYSSDGTAAGTTKRITLAKGTEGGQLTVCNGKLFYVTRSSTTSKMWRTDGTGAGTQQVIPSLAGNVNPIPNRRMAVMNNWLYFNADFDASGAELWKVQ
ncbi:MAG TPA: hypothetical protein PLB89_13190 [Flavobacteriales bacterium]|nr:hypothetical protein [Flavobacteriales bacterium]